MAPRVRLELTTTRLTVECSTIELSGNLNEDYSTRKRVICQQLFCFFKKPLKGVWDRPLCWWQGPAAPGSRPGSPPMAGSITGIPSSLLSGSASPRNERQPKATHSAPALLVLCLRPTIARRLPPGCPRWIFPEIDGCDPADVMPVHTQGSQKASFSPIRAGSARITETFRASAGNSSILAWAPPITGMVSCSRQASSTGSEKQYSTTA